MKYRLTWFLPLLVLVVFASLYNSNPLWEFVGYSKDCSSLNENSCPSELSVLLLWPGSAPLGWVDIFLSAFNRNSLGTLSAMVILIAFSLLVYAGIGLFIDTVLMKIARQQHQKAN